MIPTKELLRDSTYWMFPKKTHHLEFNKWFDRTMYLYVGVNKSKTKSVYVKKAPREILADGVQEEISVLMARAGVNQTDWRKKRVEGRGKKPARLELRNRLANDVVITINEAPIARYNRFKISMNAGAFLTIEDLEIMCDEIRKGIKEMEV